MGPRVASQAALRRTTDSLPAPSLAVPASPPAPLGAPRSRALGLAVADLDAAARQLGAAQRQRGVQARLIPQVNVRKAPGAAALAVRVQPHLRGEGGFRVRGRGCAA